MKNIQFIKESLKNLKEVGTIFPSSKFVVEKMVSPINFEKKLTILELGSGHGVITKKLLEKMNCDSQLVCFEINKKFHQELNKINNEKMILINKSAEKMKSYLNEFDIEKVDYIVSSLPLVSLPKETTNKILSDCVEVLGKSGKLIQLQYTKLLDKKLKSYYNQIDIQFTLKNYLPAFIYTCYNQKPL
jgi:phospholipid N-methyltransferase